MEKERKINVWSYNYCMPCSFAGYYTLSECKKEAIHLSEVWGTYTKVYQTIIVGKEQLPIGVTEKDSDGKWVWKQLAEPK